ncbi:Hypothetical protein ACI5QN_00672 [Bacillus cereus]
MSNGGTQKDRRSVRLVVHVQAVRLISRQIRLSLSCDGEAPYGAKSLIPRCQEKLLAR